MKIHFIQCNVFIIWFLFVTMPFIDEPSTMEEAFDMDEPSHAKKFVHFQMQCEKYPTEAHFKYL